MRGLEAQLWRRWDITGLAALNLGLALLVCGRDAEALVAYRKTTERFSKAIEMNGLIDLAEAQKSWLAEARAKPVIQLLRSHMT